MHGMLIEKVRAYCCKGEVLALKILFRSYVRSVVICRWLRNDKKFKVCDGLICNEMFGPCRNGGALLCCYHYFFVVQIKGSSSFKDEEKLLRIGVKM